MKKALVLCGGVPQIALIEELKSRGIEAILADQNPNVVARKYADKFCQVSVLDAEGVKAVAREEGVDFVLTVCADQVLLVQAQVSRELGLPCYIDYETAKNVSDKSCMKRIFAENKIPTTNYVVSGVLSPETVAGLRYPLIVKPVDSYSSRGVKKVHSFDELQKAFCTAVDISRTKTAIVEEFFEGTELSVDVYVENGTAHVLCTSALYKIPGNNKFVIHRLLYPAPVSEKVFGQVEAAAQSIADAFGIKDSPMLIQLITNGEEISVVEFCARTGGGDKFRLIENATGFNVIKAVLDLTLGIKPRVEIKRAEEHIVDEFLYCKKGVLDRLEGFEELMKNGVIDEYFQLKTKGAEFVQINSSGDRVAYFTIKDKDPANLLKRHRQAEKSIKALSIDGEDLLCHELLKNL